MKRSHSSVIVDAAVSAGIDTRNPEELVDFALKIQKTSAVTDVKSAVSREEQKSGVSRGTIRPRIPLEEFLPLKNDLLLRAARGQITERTPVWMMRQAGRYLPEYMALRVMADFFCVCRTPELACKVSLQPLERFPTLDAVIIFSDILVVPQAMGLECQMVKGKGPVFPQPLETPDDFSRINLQPNVDTTLAYVYDAINLTRERIAGRVPLIGFCGGPWTLMAYMIEGGGSRNFAKSKGWLYKFPEASLVLLDSITNSLIKYLVAQYKAGAQMLQVFESWGGELSQHHFKELVLPRLARIAHEVKKQCLNVPMTIFGKGLSYAIEDLSITEYDVIGLDWQTSPKEARRKINLVMGKNDSEKENKEATRRVSLQGNLDPCALYGNQKTLRVEIQRMLTAFGTQGHIANLGHGMQPTHDPEMAGAFIEIVQEISKEMVENK